MAAKFGKTFVDESTVEVSADEIVRRGVKFNA